MSKQAPDRREFLKKMAATAAYSAPLFFTIGARGREQTPLERAQKYLKAAREMVAKGERTNSREARMEWAREATMELELAREWAREAKASERKELERPIRTVAKAIEQLSADR